MKIPVLLNEEKVILDANPDDSLLEVLRKRKLFSVKKGCGKGRCGFCTIYLDGKPVPSCLIPAGIVRNASIITLEHFSKSAEYDDIAKGFAQAGISPCGYCNAAKYFSVHSLLSRTYHPTKEELNELADQQVCSCMNRDGFITSILYASANKLKREGRKNGL